MEERRGKMWERSAWLHRSLSAQESVCSLESGGSCRRAQDDEVLLHFCGGIQHRSASHVSQIDELQLRRSVLELSQRGMYRSNNRSAGHSGQSKSTTVIMLSRDVRAYRFQYEPNSSGKNGTVVNIASLQSIQDGYAVPAYAALTTGVAPLRIPRCHSTNGCI